MLSQLLGRDRESLERGFRHKHAVGRGTRGRLDVQYGGLAKLTVGKFCSLHETAVVLLGGGHRLDWITSYAFPAFRPVPAGVGEGYHTSNGDVTIGNDVWVGYEALIMSGVTVGDGAVIGSRAVVRKDVAPYSIVFGNPAQEVGRRFGREDVATLLETRWWDWTDAEIDARMGLILSRDVAGLWAGRPRG